MSSRADKKAAARQARLDAERAEAQRAARRRRLLMLGGVLAAALVIVGVAVGISRSGSGDESSTADGRPASELLGGIPQEGDWLGAPDAPVVMEEFADLQCPFCAEYSREVMPALIEEYVRPGRVRMRLRIVSILGPDSERGARVAAAAGLQNRQWEFVEEFFANQGEETSGYVTEDFLRERAEAVEGLDADRALGERNDPRVAEALQADQRAAQRAGLEGTPSFLAGPRGGRLQPVQFTTLSVDEFRRALDAQLQQAG
jgi:protein-disulfide isomerase